MCMHDTALLAPHARYDGGIIVHDCAVPSARPVAGLSPRSAYEIDVREFLTSGHNAIMRSTLRTGVRTMLEQGSPLAHSATLFGAYRSAWDFFNSNDPGSFDFRAQAVREFTARTIRHHRDSARDTWQFPDETLSIGRGDCEDTAFLLASLMLAAGISGYNVRVCLGTVRVHGGAGARSFDHMWVAYRTEAGVWTVVEPLSPSAHGARTRPTGARTTRAAAPSLEYAPSFGFNADHLWRYQGGEGADASFRSRAAVRRQWTRFEPRFAGFVHRSIVHDALASMQAPLLLNLLNQEFTVMLGDESKTVAEIDMPWKYHPFDHFDNGYIPESWGRVRERLEHCTDPANRGMVRDFSRAAHAIADFYAHTSYAHFAARDAQGALVLAKADDWNDAAPDRRPEYDDASDFPINRFTPATPWRGTDAQRVSTWSGALLSGRWRLPGDFGMTPEDTDWSTSLHDRRMKWRMSLPHHDKIAVDKPASSGGSNGLYDAPAYDAQYALRYDAAVRHVRRAFDLYGTELRKLG